MKAVSYKIGSALIIIGFILAVYSPYFVILGFPVFLIGAIIIALSPKVLKTKILMIFVPFVLWFPCMWLWIYSFDTFFNRSTPQTILIPNSYEGRFMIVYGEKCGIKPITENGRETLVIPDNGILIIQSEFKDGTTDDEYYLVDKQGRRKKVANLFNFEERKSKHPGVLLMSVGNFGGPVQGGSSSESPLAIHFVDYYVCNKDTTNRDDYKLNMQFDSIMQVMVDKCRGVKNNIID